MAISNNHNSPFVPSLKTLALDAIPVEEAVASIVDPQFLSDDAVYDAFLGRLDGSESTIKPVAPAYVERLHRALEATRAATVAVRPSLFSKQSVFFARFDAIYLGLGESLCRHDEAILNRAVSAEQRAAHWLSQIGSAWHKIVDFCRWLIGRLAVSRIATSSESSRCYADLTPEQSRIHVPNLPMGDVKRVRFLVRSNANWSRDTCLDCFTVEPDIRHLLPVSAPGISRLNLYSEVCALENALQTCLSCIAGALDASGGRRSSRGASISAFTRRMADKKAPVYVELGKRPSDGTPYLQLICDAKSNNMFLFSGPAAHPYRTGNFQDAEMLERLRAPR